ncbi:hypothetical protein ACFV1L_30660 [Kitasatospora sp. NPDC059646]|uniref:hypothetical protein n=1 Tax=Kitasatospora sp. NPDC059646 TaxID=3346893 RepID=UPI0036BB0145
MRKLDRAAAAVGVATVALVAGTVGAAGPAAAAPAAGRHLGVHSWTLLNQGGPGPNPGQRLTARVEARTENGRTGGHAVVEHVFDGEGTVRVEFDVDCLVVDGGAVTVTGPVAGAVATPADGSAPTTGPAGWHPETGLTFYPADAQGRLRAGWAGADLLHPENPPRATRCTPVPASAWVIGGRTVVHG